MAALLSLHNQKPPNINLMSHSHQITHRLHHQENNRLHHQDSPPLNHQENNRLHHQENNRLYHQENNRLHHQNSPPLHNQESHHLNHQESPFLHHHESHRLNHQENPLLHHQVSHFIHHQESHPPNHQESHRSFKAHGPDQRMIHRVAHTDDGVVGREHSDSSGDYRSLETDFNASFPDYDNLVPSIGLDASEEKKTGRNGCSIDNASYDNYATNAALSGVERGGPSSGCVERIWSNDRFKSEVDHSRCRRTCCKTDVCGNVVVGVKCDSFVREQQMGNDFVGKRSDSVSDAEIGEDFTRQENSTSDFTEREITNSDFTEREQTNSDISNQDQNSGVCVNSYTPNILSGERYIDDNIPGALNLPSFLANSSRVDIKCENLSGKSNFAMETSRTDEKNSNSNSLFDDTTYDNPVTVEDGLSQSGLSCRGKDVSFTSSLVKGGHFNSKATNIKRHVAFEDRDKLIDSTQSAGQTNLGKNSSGGRKTMTATANAPLVSTAVTPAIIITPSTPKNKPSVSSTGRTSSDLPKKKGNSHQTQTSNTGKKQTESDAKTNKKKGKIIFEKKRTEVDVQTSNRAPEIHVEKLTEIGVKTRKITTNKSQQKHAEVGAMKDATTNEITEEKQAKIKPKYTNTFEGKQTKTGVNTYKKRNEYQPSSARNKNSISASNNIIQRQPHETTVQIGTTVPPSAHAHVCPNTALPSEQPISDEVCKLEPMTTQPSGPSEAESLPSSLEGSMIHPVLTEDIHKGMNVNPTSNNQSASLSSPNPNAFVDICKEIDMTSTFPSSLNSNSDLDSHRATHPSSLVHSEETIQQAPRGGNCDTCLDIPGSTRETNVFRLLNLNAKSEIIHNSKDDVVNSRFASADDTETTNVQEDKSLTEPDAESLLESHYTTIPSCNKSVVCRERVLTDVECPHGEVIHTDNPGPHSKVPVDLDSAEDIYAIPIPKSLRKMVSSHAKNSPLVSEREKSPIPEETPPRRPPRSPNTASPQFQTNSVDADHPASTNRVEVTCPIKKSSTTDTLYVVPDDYDYSNIPKYGRYNFFSLGRRPKILRTVSSKDERKIAVNLEMMLRSRRQSLTDIPSTAAVDERLSVEDILKSCTEFEQSNVYYRNRTSSDSTHNTSWYSLSVFGASNHHSKINKIEETEKHQQIGPMAFTSILKKTKNEKSGYKSILKTNKDQETCTALHVKRINFADEAGKSEDEGNGREKLDRRLWDSGKGVPVSSFPSSEVVLIGQYDLKGANQKPLLKTSKVAFIGQDYLDFANQKPVFKVSPKHSKGQFDLISETETRSGLQLDDQCCDTDYDIHSEKQFIKDKINDYTRGSSNNPKISRGHFTQNSDYDSLENAVILYSLPTRPPFFTNEDTRNGSVELDCASPTKGINNMVLQSGCPSFSWQHFDQSSEMDIRSEILATPESVKSFEIKPTHADSQIESIGGTITSLPLRCAHKASTSPEAPPELYRRNETSASNSASAYSDSDHQSPIMSSSDVSGSLSPNSVFSDSPDDPSPEVMSSLSVDVFTDPSLWDVQFPTSKFPTYSPKLEAAEALKWLRAAGFPQYAQMFVERQFPLDMCVIEKDHDFLDPDSLKSLFRRLQKLNKYAGLSVDTESCKKVAGDDDGDDEYLCALSDRWEYHKSARRWARRDATSSPIQPSTMGSDPNEVPSRSCSNDSLLGHDSESQHEEESPRLGPKRRDLFASQDNYATSQTSQQYSPTKATTLQLNQHQQHMRSQDMHYASISPLQSRASIDKNKPPKGLLKRMEGFKPKRSRGQPKRSTIKEISGPIVEDSEYMRAKLERLNCVDISPKYDTISRPSFLDRSFRRSSTDIQDRNTCLDISTNQISPRSIFSSASTRSQSDLISSSSETSCPSPNVLASKNQHASCYNLKPYQVTLEVQEQHPFTKGQTPINVLQRQRNDVQKILQETNLEDNVQITDLHHSGRFPLDLPNGYTETPTRSNAHRRGIDKLSSWETGLMPGSMLTFPSKNRILNHRKSIYDNILPSELNFEEQEPRMVFPGIYELRKGGSENLVNKTSGDFVQSKLQDSFEVRKHRFFRDVNPGLHQQNAAHISSSGLPVSKTSDQQIHRPVRERSVSFETSLSSQSPKESAKYSEGEICSIDSQTNIHVGYESSPSKSRGILHTSSPLVTPKEITLGIEAELSSIDSRSSIRTGSESSPSKSRGIFHSSSADSYFRGDTNSHSRDEVSFGNNNGEEGEAPRAVLKKEYEDLDVILQQLYHNIDELTSYMSKEQPESRPSQHNNSFGVYGIADLDTETSLSGGEGSTTAGSSSEDFVLTDLSRDNSLDQISEATRERKDSGVGQSLNRASSDRQRKKIRWHSFQKSHRPAVSSRDMQMNSLTVCQMVRLQKLSLLKLTGIMEKCLPISRSGWNWMMPRFLKKQKITDFSDKKVFGVPFSVMTQRTGQPLPQCVLYAMRYLRRNCSNAVGIFRKSGVKSKIQQLRDDLENDPDTVDFEGMNAYNVADMLKTYFRDLPECLLTNKMSEIFRSIYIHVPQSQRLEAIQTAIVLLPDDNREVLQSVLLFLSDVSSYEADHQMNASNLAVCFMPTVFQLGPQQVPPHSPKRGYKNSPGIPDPREILEQKAAHECLLMMILECKKLFSVTPSLYQQIQGQSSAHMKPIPLQDIGTSPLDVRAFGQERIQMVLKEAHDKNRGWIQILTDSDVEVYCRKPLDDCPLKEWKLIVEIEAPPIEVLHRIMHERHVWDEDLLNWSVVEKLGPHADVFQFVLNSMAPHPCRHFLVLRYWRSDLNKGACSLITMSVDHADAMEVSGVAATDLGSYFLMEPCGSGRSRLTHITRMDTRGRAPEWYTRIFGHFCANFLDRLRESFRQVTSGPETRV